ncbi:MFS general substrate transporter [Aspergillus welwitschiae]|uniref:MFS general substrate transporter n=1 Tax=Aspergillus welwitschiae TaxID=1341132 RepID=A0A3F3PM54_9EURO|nr:MFS general substrate transporter [Aspergillus welwitschiae]RDH27999.1 MFS general substrate transporter [Aspergillus welwitschiae]
MATTTGCESISLTELGERPIPTVPEGPNNDSSVTEAEAKVPYLKLIASGFSFFVAGVNDGSLGSLLPYVLETYHVSTGLVIIVYVTTLVGWLVAALTNSTACQYLGLGAMLALGAALQVLAHVLRAWLPPFPLYAITFFLASLGQAFNDTHANTYVAAVKAAHRWLGFIHAMYMAGCLVGPLVATAVASANRQSQWNLFYIFPLGLGLINLILILIAFRDSMSVQHSSEGPQSDDPQASSQDARSTRAVREIKDTLRVPAVWLTSLYFFFFLGAAITAGGWIVEYLVRVRHGDVHQMGYIPTGFYGGAFLGRLVLAEPTYRLGERRMIFIYAALCAGLELVFWLVPNIGVEAMAICLLGFFSGPFFATGISVASKIFPAKIRSSGIGTICLRAGADWRIALPRIDGNHIFPHRRQGPAAHVIGSIMRHGHQLAVGTQGSEASCRLIYQLTSNCGSWLQFTSIQPTPTLYKIVSSLR